MSLDLGPQIVQAVAALYGHDPAAQKDAERWLRQLQRTPQGWSVPQHLLVPGQVYEPERFYTARSIYTPQHLSPECRGTVLWRIYIVHQDLKRLVWVLKPNRTVSNCIHGAAFAC